MNPKALLETVLDLALGILIVSVLGVFAYWLASFAAFFGPIAVEAVFVLAISGVLFLIFAIPVISWNERRIHHRPGHSHPVSPRCGIGFESHNLGHRERK